MDSEVAGADWKRHACAPRHNFTWFKSPEHEAEYRRFLYATGHRPDVFWRAFAYLLTAAGVSEKAEPRLRVSCGVPPEIAEEVGDITGGQRRMIAVAMHLWCNQHPFDVTEMGRMDEVDKRACLEAITHLVINIG